MTYSEARERVARGANFLDQKCGGPDWVKAVDLDKVEVSNTEVCVLGQLYDGDFTNAVDQGLVSCTELPSYGFSLSVTEEMQITLQERTKEELYHLLNRAWIDEIKLRQQSAIRA